MLFKVLSLVYAARQQAKLKRRWPLRTAIIVAPGKTAQALRKVEPIFLELSNVKTVEYKTEVPTYAEGENWVSAVEGDLTVVVSGQRDDKLLGEGIMRDLARRVQALRKELGYMPTDVLDGVHIAGLDSESSELVTCYLGGDGGVGSHEKSEPARENRGDFGRRLARGGAGWKENLHQHPLTERDKVD